MDARPTGYLIPTGEADTKRLDALGAIFNPSSLSWMLENRPPKGAMVLDVGCGNGCLSKLFAETFKDASFVGVDISPEQIALCQKKSDDDPTNISWHVADAYHLEELKVKHPALFDVVHCRFILSHLPKPEDAVDQMFALVKPGGILIIEELGEKFHFECKDSPPAFRSWQTMIEFQHKLQQSHKNTVEKVKAHLSSKSVGFATKVYDIPVEGSFKKSMFRIGVEHGLKKMKEVGMPQLIEQFGYKDGNVWLEEMEAIENNPSITLTARNFECIVAKKG